MDELEIFVCTYNSGETLARCLSSLRASSPQSRIVAVDHMSTDSTVDICDHFGVKVLEEGVGLGHARQMCFELAEKEFMAFVDSDVEVIEPHFFRRALVELRRRGTGAVVGMALGHRFAYGLPASLLVMRTADFRGVRIPDSIDARETFYIQRRLDELHLKTLYMSDAMVHSSKYRGFKPEWEGANTRLACGVDLGQLAFAMKVVLLMSLNSRSPRNVAYFPIFYLKFLRGFSNPGRWSRLKRG